MSDVQVLLLPGWAVHLHADASPGLVRTVADLVINLHITLVVKGCEKLGV